MAINKQLLKELRKKMGVTTERRVHQKIKEIKDTQLVSNEKAAYMLAYEYGIPLSKYLDGQELEEIRSLIKTSRLEPVKIIKKATSSKTINLNVYIEKIFKKIREPLLSAKIFSEAKKMTQYYPFFYVLENSIRNLIIIVMSKKYGKNWWKDEIENNKNFNNVCSSVEIRKKDENEIRWHGKRNKHEIFYTDLDELRKLIIDYWKNFKDILKKQSWFDNMLNTIKISRNIIAHNNPLSDRDFRRIEINLDDWCDQMKLAKEKLGV
jgi:hypothetical protein